MATRGSAAVQSSSLSASTVGAMSWFLVPVRCAGPFGPDAREALCELADDVTAVVSVTEGAAEPASGRRTFEVVLAIDAQDAGAAAARVPATFATDPDFELVSVGEVRTRARSARKRWTSSAMRLTS